MALNENREKLPLLLILHPQPAHSWGTSSSPWADAVAFLLVTQTSSFSHRLCCTQHISVFFLEIAQAFPSGKMKLQTHPILKSDNITALAPCSLPSTLSDPLTPTLPNFPAQNQRGVSSKIPLTPSLKLRKPSKTNVKLTGLVSLFKRK